MGFELKRKLEYSDLQVAPDDGRRHELFEGELFVSPSPSPLHQSISKRLLLLLVSYFESRKIGLVFDAPIDLILTGQDVFVPDLVVVADRNHITQRGIEGPPLLVVEILSPFTRTVDLGTKARRYAEMGIEHYWIVDPETRRTQCYRSVNGAFQPLVEAEGDVVITHPTWDGLRVDLSTLWTLD